MSLLQNQFYLFPGSLLQHCKHRFYM